jgi:tetratricopeptide (TPR) repeat protein
VAGGAILSADVRRLAPTLVLVCLFSAGPALAHGQDIPGPTDTPSESEVAEARGLYQAGNAAADAGRFADALSQYTRAFSLSGNPAALYNAARTLRSLGRHVEARHAFDQLLTGVPGLSDTTRSEATQLRDEEAARIASLALDDLPAASPQLVLHIDGVFRPDGGARPFSLELDPGEHGLVVELAGFTPFTWQGTLADGARERVSVQLAALPQGRSIVEEPLFWIIVGVVAIAAGILAGYFIWDAEQLRPNSGTVIRL